MSASFKEPQEIYNRVPVSKEVFADLDTPLSAYLKLADNSYSFLFESVQGGEKWGRYSIIGLAATTTIKIYGNNIQIFEQVKKVDDFVVEDVFDWIQSYYQQFKVAPYKNIYRHEPIFTGGLVGFFGYDTIKMIEPRLNQTSDEPEIEAPDILLMVSEEVLVFDTLSGKINIIVHANSDNDKSYNRAQSRIEEIYQALRTRKANVQTDYEMDNIDLNNIEHSFSEADFKDAIKKIKDYIVAGDVMQVALSQRMSLDFKAPPINLYRSLRSLNPSPYMFYLNLDDIYIVGSSPEILVRLEAGVVTVRPIAGTRHRGSSEAEDLALAEELLADPKELAEHLMLIDLGRNDVGKISATGTVELTDKMAIERYSHVMHIVSNITGVIKANTHALEVLKAIFPAGTLSGAPKIRAMEIIEELEPVKRGIYSGAVGYLGWNGNLDTAIAIRTAVIKDEKLYIQAGAGIVHDSVPDNEWNETINKAQALLRAAEIAASGEI